MIFEIIPVSKKLFKLIYESIPSRYHHYQMIKESDQPALGVGFGILGDDPSTYIYVPTVKERGENER